ncbi:MAG: hypothetical protein DCC73_12525 [Proteobacteria bacterium]|nr:MAG: hypothetical protein DCC73_12525 [Pseudomonadota bacterium]
MDRLCGLFYMLNPQTPLIELICEQLGECGYVICVARLCELYQDYRIIILNSAMLGAVRKNNQQAIGDLPQLGADNLIVQLCLPEPQGELSLRDTLLRALECLRQQAPHAAQIWIERYINDCVTRANIDLDVIEEQARRQTIAERIAQDLIEQIAHLLEYEDDGIEGGPTIDLLMEALLRTCRTERTRLINHLCQIMAAVVDNAIDLSAFWTRLIRNNDFIIIRIISSFVRSEEERTYVLDICLVCAVRICDIAAVRLFLTWGASPRIALIGRRQVPGGDFNPDIHMPLLDLCIRRDLINANCYTALILIAHGAPYYLHHGETEISCMTMAITNREWVRVQRLCFLGVSCTTHMQAIAQDQNNMELIPTPEEAILMLNGINEALILICRLPPGLRGAVWQFYATAIDANALIAGLNAMIQVPRYASIRERIAYTLVLLQLDFGVLHQQITQGLSVITAIEFSNDDFLFFRHVCQSPHPPTLTELLAWIRLYVLNNPDIMSRDELFALIHRRCFPGEHQ